MSCLTMSIMGIERYITERGEDSLFKDILLPEGLEKELIVNTILNDTASFETLYSNPTYLRFLIFNWFKSHYYTFNKWISALAIEYDPLNNYDRKEEYIDTEGSETTGNDNMTSTSTSSDNTTGDVTEQTVPYEDSDLTNRSKSISNSSDNASTSGSTTSNTTARNDRTLTHTAHLYGNIGVTTSQQMLESELDVARFNIIQQISDLFCTDFCLMIY